MSEGLSVTPEGGGRQSDHEAPKKRAVLGQIRSFLNVRFCLGNRGGGTVAKRAFRKARIEPQFLKKSAKYVSFNILPLGSTPLLRTLLRKSWSCDVQGTG